MLDRPRLSRRWLLALALLLVVPALAFTVALVAAPSAGAEELRFDDVTKQSKEFMRYEATIKLTPAQEAIKEAALTALPAPCCSDNTAYTCCCPCNMARTIWGLAAFLITEHDYRAAQVQAKVEEWIEFINPKGFSGDVCYTSGGCQRAFQQNGCGGMHPSRLAS